MSGEDEEEEEQSARLQKGCTCSLFSRKAHMETTEAMLIVQSTYGFDSSKAPLKRAPRVWLVPLVWFSPTQQVQVHTFHSDIQ